MSRSSISLTGGPTAVSLSWRPFWLIPVAILVGITAGWLSLGAAAALIGGAALVLITLIQPLAGLTIALFAGPLGALENVIFGSSLPESGQLLFLLAVAAWIGHGVLCRRLVIPRNALILPLAIFVAVATMTLLYARSLSVGLREVVKWVEIGLVMIMVLDLAGSESSQTVSELSLTEKVSRTVKSERRLLAVLVLVGVSQAVLGIWQFGLRGDGPDHFMILDRFYRSFGTFNQPNPFGGFMGICASIAIGAFLGLMMARNSSAGNSQPSSRTQWMWIVFFAAGAILTFAALVMSWSRGAWLGFGASMVVTLVFLPRSRWFGVLLVGLLIALLLLSLGLNLIPASITGRLGDFSQDLRLGYIDIRGVDIENGNFADLERLAHWQAGIEMARHNLWQGVGFGNYGPAYSDYALVNWPNPLGHAHNYYLNVLAETGVLGLVTYLMFWLVVFIQALSLLQRLPWPRRGYALGLLAAWTAMTVHHVVDKLYVNNLYIFMGVMLGVQLLLAKRYD